MNFRVKNFLVSVLFPFLALLFLRIARLEGFILYGSIFIAILIQYFLSFWLFNFTVFPQGFISILLLPALWFGSFMLIFMNFVVQLNIFSEILIIAGVLILQYYFLTTQNILNLAHFRSISLSQAAYTTNHFYTVITFFSSNLAVFLLPNISYILKFIISLILFVIIQIIFSLLNKINKYQYLFSIVIYTFITFIVSILYAYNLFLPDRIVLIVIAFSVIFRQLVILPLYYEKKVLSLFDYIQLSIETLVIIFLFIAASQI